VDEQKTRLVVGVVVAVVFGLLCLGCGWWKWKSRKGRQTVPGGELGEESMGLVKEAELMGKGSGQAKDGGS
jgi:hypothetical protein